MSAKKSPVTKFKTFFKKLPKLVKIASGTQSDIC
jgi:hypothetical protein